MVADGAKGPGLTVAEGRAILAADRPPAIDRSVVMDEGLKNAARLSIRLLLVGLLAAGLIVEIGRGVV